MNTHPSIETCTQPVEALPIVKHYMDKLGIPALLDKYVPNQTRADIAPAQVLSMLILNILSAPSPLYAIPEWLGKYVDGMGEDPVQANQYNDDRSARVLTHLFHADRHSLLTELSARIIQHEQLQLDVIHNDTTSITLLGDYRAPHSEAVQPRYGHNKDFRPDCKQLIFGLNVTADGHVPLSYQLYDGHQADVTTHQTNWQGLREQLGKTDFIYVADSKLCSRDNLDTIASAGGRFITVMPRNIANAKTFIQQVEAGFEPDWHDQFSQPDRRKKDREHHYRLHESAESWQGYRVLWVHSSAKAHTQEKQRQESIDKATKALATLQPKLNRYRLKGRQQIEAAIDKAVGAAKSYLTIELSGQTETHQVKKGRGRPGPDSHYEIRETTRYQLNWQVNEDAVEQAARSDGLFPLLTNTTLPPREVLQTYKQQPYLERRFLASKSVLEVAPVFLKDNRRIEAMMLLFFIALSLHSLIERTIRQAMAAQSIDALPIRPSGLKTAAPTWRVIRQFFADIHLSSVKQGSLTLQVSLKGLSALHQQVLSLLNVPERIYTALQSDWWTFVEP